MLGMPGKLVGKHDHRLCFPMLFLQSPHYRAVNHQCGVCPCHGAAKEDTGLAWLDNLKSLLTEKPSTTPKGRVS